MLQKQSTPKMASNMEKKIYALINCLADNYGFDVDTAFEYARWETDVDHVGEILKMTDMDKKPEAKKPAPEKEEGDSDKIATCKKNISLWEKKLADGKVKDADKQREKIAKEKAKLSKLEAKAPAEKPKEEPKTEVKAEPEKKAEVKADEKKEKRIKRFSPVMASQLKKALEDVSVEMNDKLKKEFQQYVEDLTDDDFRATGLADHMRDFAKNKSPTKVEEKKPEKVDPPTVVDVGIDELRGIAMTAEVDPPGTYWDADNGRFVKGPDADDDEDVTETKFNGKDYVVGDKTGRVYEVRETGDIFAGFAGVGKFKDIKV